MRTLDNIHAVPLTGPISVTGATNCDTFNMGKSQGARIFVMAEPDQIICIDKHTGRQLWTRFLTRYHATPSAQRLANPAFREKVDPLIAKLPGTKTFEARMKLRKEIDRLIRKYGYLTTEEILGNVEANDDLRENLSAAAHLIHGSSEKRFTITYCPGNVSREEIEGVGYMYHDLDDMTAKYDPNVLTDGWNDLANGERIYYISNPAIGLWSHKDRFKS